MTPARPAAAETASLAAHELLKRRNARAALLPFTTYTFPGYRPEPAHALITEALDRVAAGKTTRLMIFAPPQHGKSELTSVRFPALWLGRRPDDPIILCSYAASLAESKSRQVRDLVDSPEYRALFPTSRVATYSRAVNHWRLGFPHRAGLLAAGVGGPITGHGALLGIIDDPHENWEQAQSQTMRDRVWDWYRGTFRTRIWTGGAIVLIMTRWHADDLAGRLLRAQPHDWTVLRLPALAESQAARDATAHRFSQPPGRPDPLGRAPGEALCPQRFPSPTLHAIRDDIGPRAWSSEYQGDPTPGEGSIILRKWFRLAPAPAGAPSAQLRYWDKAATVEGCQTAGVLMARYPDGRYHIHDVVCGRWTPADRDAHILATARADGQAVPILIEQEPGSAGIDAITAAVKLLAGFNARPDRATGDKDTRLQPFLAQLEAGHVTLSPGPYTDPYIDELCGLPAGQFRDQVDATAGAFNALARTPATGPTHIIHRPDPLQEIDHANW